MDKPKPAALVEALKISPAYASMLLSGDRVPPQRLAIDIYRATGWRMGIIEKATEVEIDMLDRMTPAREVRAA